MSEQVEGRFERNRRETSQALADKEPKPIREDDVIGFPDEHEEHNDLQAEHLETPPENPPEEDNTGSFSSLAKEEEVKIPYVLTEQGATVNEQEFHFKLLNNGEMLECEVERRKLLGGSLFPAITGQDGSIVSDPMNEIAFMMAVMKRCISFPKGYIAKEMGGFESDYLDRVVPTYRAYQAWREKELDHSKSKSKR